MEAHTHPVENSRIVTMNVEQNVICALSTGAIINDLSGLWRSVHLWCRSSIS